MGVHIPEWVLDNLRVLIKDKRPCDEIKIHSYSKKSNKQRYVCAVCKSEIGAEYPIMPSVLYEALRPATDPHQPRFILHFRCLPRETKSFKTNGFEKVLGKYLPAVAEHYFGKGTRGDIVTRDYGWKYGWVVTEPAETFKPVVAKKKPLAARLRKLS